MTPLKLTLVGFRGIYDGMGLEEFTIDFREYADKHLIAISAPNGRGKSTIFDNAQPYPIMPSRASAYSSAAFSYYEELVSLPGRNSSIDFLWSHQGVTYRKVLTFKVTEKTRTTKAWLYVVDGDTETPYEAPDGVKSNGKMSTYEHCVESIMGSAMLYFTSAYGCQERKKLTSESAGDVKTMLAELLGQDSILERGKQCAEIAKGVAAQLVVAQKAAEKSSAAVIALTAERNKLSAIEDAVVLVRKDLVLAEANLVQARRELDIVKGSATDKAALLARHAEITGQIERTRASIQELIDSATGEQRKLSNAIAAEEGQHKARLTGIEAQKGRVQRVITQAEHTLSQRDEVADAVEKLPGAMLAVSGAEEALRERQELNEQAVDLSSKLGRKTAEIDHLATKITGLTGEMQGNKTRAALIGNVPCVDVAEFTATCPLLENARQAQERIAQQEVLLQGFQAEAETAKQAAEELQAQLDQIGPTVPAVREAQATLREAQDAVSRYQQLVPLADAMSAAQSNIASARTELDELEQSLLTSQEYRDANVATITAEMTQVNAKIDALKTRLTDETSALRANLPDLSSADHLAGVESKVKAAAADVDSLQKSIDESQPSLAAAKASVTLLERTVEELKPTVAAVEKYELELAYWNLLTKALGRDGVLPLLIDDAAPAISSVCNDLLVTGYGPRFSIGIETQTETRDGTLRETFQIMVYDSQSDSPPKPLRSVSGGERVWIYDCLTRAIAVYQAEQSGQTYEVMISDETDGPLDLKHKRQFVQMKREVMERAGCRQEYFVTHTPELLSLADAVIEL